MGHLPFRVELRLLQFGEVERTDVTGGRANVYTVWSNVITRDFTEWVLGGQTQVAEAIDVFVPVR